ncbi:MAG: hypothetical protein B9S37_08120 [Verrucomicrobiia bacterium Tous-C3TDCM]|nr:MAG: hypothetical protein B9S37_08120 [Verrucomicrobiae bacterium Tous-C3TDCM]PAZ05286.1 MAG: hypothetical protein CAK88_09425 [Verrucomicrobiae bacterium AMD-G2]
MLIRAIMVRWSFEKIIEFQDFTEFENFDATYRLRNCTCQISQKILTRSQEQAGNSGSWQFLLVL